MRRCSEIVEILEGLAPRDYACEWDNPGLLVGRGTKEVGKILVALDVTDEVIDMAVDRGADMIVSHHPLIFRGIKSVNDGDFIGRRILRLIQHDISCFAMHTNFDIAPGGMADLAAEYLGLSDGKPLEVTGVDLRNGTEPVGIGKTGYLKKSVTVEQAARLVKEKFNLPYVVVYGADQKEINTDFIAVSPGSGSSMISHGLKAGVQILVTGDIGHHEGIDAAANGMAVIDAGHYGLEHIFIPFVTGYLREHLGQEAKIWEMPPAFPASVL